MAVLVGDLSSPNVFLNGSNLFSLSPYPTTLSQIQIVQVFETRLDGQERRQNSTRVVSARDPKTSRKQQDISSINSVIFRSTVHKKKFHQSGGAHPVGGPRSRSVDVYIIKGRQGPRNCCVASGWRVLECGPHSVVHETSASRVSIVRDIKSLSDKQILYDSSNTLRHTLEQNVWRRKNLATPHVWRYLETIE